MIRPGAAACVLGLGLAIAHAQNAPETGAAPTAPAEQPAAPAAQPPTTQPSGVAQPPASQPTGKEARAQCRANAVAQGLTGRALKAAVDDCFAKARPDLAKRQQCRAQGMLQGLHADTLQLFVKKCVAGM